MERNKPYVKQYENGVLVNEIKDRYVNAFQNRQHRKRKLGRLFNNKKGIQLVVTYIGKGKFYKSIKHLVRFPNKTIINYNN